MGKIKENECLSEELNYFFAPFIPLDVLASMLSSGKKNVVVSKFNSFGRSGAGIRAHPDKLICSVGGVGVDSGRSWCQKTCAIKVGCRMWQ